MKRWNLSNTKQNKLVEKEHEWMDWRKEKNDEDDVLWSMIMVMMMNTATTTTHNQKKKQQQHDQMKTETEKENDV